jgi:RimJ/RimL family protein N-acetyltransferase
MTPKRRALRGRRIILSPASAEDARPIYEWLACSDLTATMLGPPTYPELPVPTWEQFRADYLDHFFDGSSPELGRCFVIRVEGEQMGQVNYNDIQERGGRKRVELDIWLSGSADCGHGFGPEALDVLCRHLAERFGVRDFMVQPSARNPRAIRAYEKAGFVRIGMDGDRAREQWGPSDYFDSVYMVRTFASGGGMPRDGTRRGERQ